MEKKTVLRLGLTRWGYLDPHDVMTMNAVDENELPDETVVDSQFAPERHNPEQVMRDLGFEPAEGISEEELKQQEQQQAIEEEEREEEDQHTGPVRPYDPETLKAYLTDQAEKLKDQRLVKREREETAACLDYVLQGKGGERRYELTSWLFGFNSMKDATPGQVLALYNWIKPAYDKNAAVFLPDPTAAKEATTAHTYALSNNGQGKLL